MGLYNTLVKPPGYQITILTNLRAIDTLFKQSIRILKYTLR